MTEPEDGAFVSYVGIPHDGHDVGDEGRLLHTAGHGAHVKWASGPLAGQITLVDVDDLVQVPRRTAVAAADGLEDSLLVGTSPQPDLRHLCALRGPGAVAEAVASTRPTDLAQVTAAVRSFAEERVAQAPSIRQAVSSLDEEEGAEVVRLATLALLRQTFGLADG